MLRIKCQNCEAMLQINQEITGPFPCPKCGNRLQLAAVTTVAPLAPVRVEEAPRPKPRPKSKPRPESKSNWPVFVVLAGAGLLLFGGAVVVVMIMIARKSSIPTLPEPTRPKTIISTENFPTSSTASSSTTGSVAPTQTLAPPTTGPGTTSPAPVTLRHESLAAERAYARLLKHAVILQVPLPMNRGDKWGYGVVVSRDRRLVLTTASLVAQTTNATCYFPSYDQGDLMNRRDQYSKRMVLGRNMSRINIDPQKNLALLSFVDLATPELNPIPMPRTSARPGQSIHVLGTNGTAADSPLWHHLIARVRQVGERDFNTTPGQSARASLVETEGVLPIVDDGAPMMNGRGELVGLHCPYAGTPAQTSAGIDGDTIRKYLEGYFQATNSRYDNPIPAPLVGLADMQGLLAKVENRDPGTRRYALRSLGEMGEEARPAMKYFIKALKDPDPENRTIAADQLRGLPPTPPELPLLIPGLKDSDASIRRLMIEMVGKLGVNARPALPELIALLQDPEADLRMLAIETIGKLGASGSEAYVPLLYLVQGEDRALSRAASEALSKLGAPSTTALQAVRKLAKSTVPHHRLAALEILATHDADSTEAWVGLISVLNHDEAAIREAAALIVARMKTATLEQQADALAAQIPVLADMARRREGAQRLVAITLLGAFGPRAKAHVKDLRPFLAPGDAQVRLKTVETLGRIGLDARDTLPDLIKLLDEMDPALIQAVATTLARFGPEAKDAVKSLVLVLSRNDSSFDASVDALAKVGKPAIPALEKALDNRGSASTRRGAAQALGKMGPAAKDSYLALRNLLKDKDKDVRKAAEAAIQSINR